MCVCIFGKLSKYGWWKKKKTKDRHELFKSKKKNREKTLRDEGRMLKFSYHEHNTIPESSVLCMPFPSFHKRKENSSLFFPTIEYFCLTKDLKGMKGDESNQPPLSIPSQTI